MARNRTISPDFWTWEAVIDCKPMTRLLFIGLWNFADDGGVQPLRPRTIRMQVFPGDDVDANEVRSMIDELAAQGLVRIYCVDSVEYVAIVDWDQLQRVGKRARRRYPPMAGDPSSPTIVDHGVVESPPSPPFGEAGEQASPTIENPIDNHCDDRPGPHAEEAAKRLSRSMGNRQGADCPPFETRPKSARSAKEGAAPQSEVVAAAAA